MKFSNTPSATAVIPWDDKSLKRLKTAQLVVALIDVDSTPTLLSGFGRRRFHAHEVLWLFRTARRFKYILPRFLTDCIQKRVSLRSAKYESKIIETVRQQHIYTYSLVILTGRMSLSCRKSFMTHFMVTPHLHCFGHVTVAPSTFRCKNSSSRKGATLLIRVMVISYPVECKAEVSAPNSLIIIIFLTTGFPLTSSAVVNKALGPDQNPISLIPDFVDTLLSVCF